MTKKDNNLIKTTNPYSGQSEMLTEEEFALYPLIKQKKLSSMMPCKKA